MKAEYTELGFKKPEYLDNKYGIKIYLGTTDKDDWCVEIPKKFMGKYYEKYSYEQKHSSQIGIRLGSAETQRRHTRTHKGLEL